MTKVRCQHCKEFPYRWRWALGPDGESGKECSLCDAFRPTKSRRSAKRAMFDRLIEELINGQS